MHTAEHDLWDKSFDGQLEMQLEECNGVDYKSTLKALPQEWNDPVLKCMDGLVY